MLGKISTKILYQNCDTFLQVSLKRKDQINENHLQFINSNSAQGVMNVRWEKTATRNVLKYDVSNMTALSEYIKQTITQDKYFELVGQIQKILEFCNDSNLPVNNLILNDPKNVYYDVEMHKIYVAYLPLMENDYRCSNIVRFLNILNKKAKISVTNGNMMNRYAEFLSEHLRIQKGKSDKNSCFTYNHLYNFLHDTANIRPEAPAADIVQPAAAPVPEKAAETAPVKKAVPEDDGDHTILVSRKVKEKCEVYLTDENGRVYPLDHFPFTIGRKKENDLAVTGNRTVSGEHAAILCENGEYCIEDRESGNGTFLNETAASGRRITKEKLRNGDVIYIYDAAFRFTNEAEDEGTYIVGSKKKAVAEAPEPAKPAAPEEKSGENKDNAWDMYTVAYLVNNTANEKIPLYSYPFTCSEVSGIMIGQDSTGSRHSIYIKNMTCDALSIEGSDVAKGEKVNIFSGCNFTYHGTTYTFYEEN